MNRLMLLMLFEVVMVGAGTMVVAGNSDSPAPPSDASSAMFTLDDLYNRLNSGAAGIKRSGVFAEPAAGPGSTGHSLDELMGTAPATNANAATAADVLSGKVFWGLHATTWGTNTGGRASAPIARTGQTPTVPLNLAPTGSDGDRQKGVAWPNPRFTDNGNQTVTDNLTGLTWSKDANLIGHTTNWTDAIIYCNCLSLAGQSDWRLPHLQELYSLVDWRYYNPSIPNTAGTAKWSVGDPFSNIVASVYWSSTSFASNTATAWGVTLFTSLTFKDNKTANTYYVWPVPGP